MLSQYRSVPIFCLRGGMSLYSYRASGPKAYKNVLLFIRDVIHINLYLNFLI